MANIEKLACDFFMDYMLNLLIKISFNYRSWSHVIDLK